MGFDRRKELLATGFGVQAYRCFGSEVQLIHSVKPVNVVVGRNNSGKSAFLDGLSAATQTDRSNAAAGAVTVLLSRLADPALGNVFSANTSGGSIPGNHEEYGRRFRGEKVTFAISGRERRFIGITGGNDLRGRQNALIDHLQNPFEGMVFRRLAAERDIVPEDISGDGTLGASGAGATRLMAKLLVDAGAKQELVEHGLLTNLNEIFLPDLKFDRISAKRLDSEKWEIFLDEAGKASVALSQSGSGLKTVILALLNLVIIPVMSGKDWESYCFAFEELENNLHPAVQRRLFRFLRDHVVEKGGCLFVSTHSSVPIDRFAKDEDAQIIHVTQVDSRARIDTVEGFSGGRRILDDLDIRASDVLQSNGVIWVEGPSDRVFLNRWIDVWTEGQLQEDVHYQVVFYGGRLLAHLSAAEPDEVTEAIRVLLVNRNCAFLIDSDCRGPDVPLNDTKNRIVDEAQKAGQFVWVTSGREIENYLSPAFLKRELSVEDYDESSRYQHIEELAFASKLGQGKVKRAQWIAPRLQKEDLESWLDLGEKLEALCSAIRAWNRI